MREFHAGSYDVAVIGAGHAGIEASLACARLGMKTVCFTINLDAVGNMPCNPAIGGTGKGHLVRELDALGGEMARAARYARGFRMDFSAVRRNETSPLTGHKTLNYGDCILEHRAAAAAGMDERIFLNMRGKLAEGTVSNLFLVSGGRIYTPALSCGLLPGVLRSYLLERYRVEEGEIDPRELENFDECFVTNSLMGVMPVQQLGERVFPSRETVDRLRSAYEAEKGTLQ